MNKVRVKPGTQSETSAEKREGFAAGALELVELDGRKKFFDLRDRWSAAILWWISVLIVFNGALTVSVGLGRLNYSEYKRFIASVTAETFLQIVGMGYVAVHFLFSDSR